MQIRKYSIIWLTQCYAMYSKTFCIKNNTAMNTSGPYMVPRHIRNYVRHGEGFPGGPMVKTLTFQY